MSGRFGGGEVRSLMEIVGYVAMIGKRWDAMLGFSLGFLHLNNDRIGILRKTIINWNY